MSFYSAYSMSKQNFITLDPEPVGFFVLSGVPGVVACFAWLVYELQFTF